MLQMSKDEVMTPIPKSLREIIKQQHTDGSPQGEISVDWQQDQQGLHWGPQVAPGLIVCQKISNVLNCKSWTNSNQY